MKTPLLALLLLCSCWSKSPEEPASLQRTSSLEEFAKKDDAESCDSEEELQKKMEEQLKKNELPTTLSGPDGGCAIGKQ